MLDAQEFAIEHPLSIREKVYTLILDLILSGRIAPAERLVENRLAELLGVSRTPVREALHGLEREGFVEAIPRIGYQVREIQWEEVEELCEIRQVNEAQAARWAVQRITATQLRGLRENLAAAEAEGKKRDARRFFARDGAFHDLLVQASGNQRLVEICQSLRRQMFLYRTESVFDPEAARRLLADHRRIVEHLEQGDVTGIEAAIGDHLKHAKADIFRRVFDQKGRAVGAGR